MAYRYVLLVEQDPHLSNLLDLFLHGKGFEVNVASTIAEAIGLASSRMPDVVVVGSSAGADLLARQLRAFLADRGTPVVRLHEKWRPQDVVDAVRRGRSTPPSTQPVA